MAKSSHLRGAVTSREFESALRRHPRLQKLAVAVAKAVLVDGSDIQATARRYGVSRQRVYSASRLLYHDVVPLGWHAAYVCLPPKLMKDVLALELKVRRDWTKGSGRSRPALTTSKLRTR